MSQTPTDVKRNPANMLGLDYAAQAATFRYAGPIYDVHTHIGTLDSAEVYFHAADDYGITKTWSMTNRMEQVDALAERWGKRIAFIAVPNYEERDNPETFTSHWLKRIEAFAERGCMICKFWAAPRGLDLAEHFWIDSPIRFEAMDLAKSLGMKFMSHVGDPDTWFATKYSDSSRYGTKREHFDRLRRVMDRYGDVPWLGAHMGGSPEDLEYLQVLIDTYPNYVVDTSATKWMVRELSKRPDAFRDFCRRNPGRVLFGSDIVTTDANIDYDLYASRYWSLKTLLETNYDGPSPIVDPDLSMVDPSLPEDSTALLRGAGFDDELLRQVYQDAPRGFFGDETAVR
ncbi:amidohydrolase family protein [Mucisphaera calidilacus]|uniref:Amidohydrolase n=1 Tax=Mucisphaera calidilacus TaxID=2527982 RepID=A0A518BUI7_9BACT|nr:amidohydrolase family protein [Mucisphaera calidilacus]QDU70650.1 Amidohydrolase [Mucisphaera calidilacus]